MVIWQAYMHMDNPRTYTCTYLSRATHVQGPPLCSKKRQMQLAYSIKQAKIKKAKEQAEALIPSISL
jgi:hypothetical protein